MNKHLFLPLLAAFTLALGLAACDNVGDDAADIDSNAYTDPSEAISGQGITPRFIEGNIGGDAAAVCNAEPVNQTDPPETWLGIFVNGSDPTSEDGITTTISGDDNQYLAWDAESDRLVRAVVMKGGDDTFIYDYNASTPYLYNDWDLRSPDNNGGNVPEISHYYICYQELEDPSQGCTPGYWKNHPDAWGDAGFSPNQTVGSVFSGASPYADATLLEALNFGGGSGVDGAKRILLRAAVAALLSAAHPDVDYPREPADVVADVNAALASGDRPTMLALATALDADNNLGCPLN